MHVFTHGKVCELAVESPRGDDRELMAEVDNALDHGFLMANQPPHALRVFNRAEAMLTFAVVPEGRCLDDRRRADVAERLSKVVERVDGSARRDGKAVQRKKRLFTGALLGNVQ